MNLFRKLFGSSKSKKSEEKLKPETRGKYMPDVKLPIDERFTINFQANGGKFLYCEDMNEIFEALNNILDENSWHDNHALMLDENLSDRFSEAGINRTKAASKATYFLTTCENLIADDGSIMISSRQIAEKKLAELPNNFIVFCTTSQMVENISEGLRGIKTKNRKKIPTNITTIKHFKFDKKKKKDDDFLSYGRSSKNLYLLLLEDL